MAVLARAQGLGLIPSWQWQETNPPNIGLNPHLTYPDGHAQADAQPYATSRFWNGADGGTYVAPVNFKGLRGSGLGLFDFFDSWAWNNRKFLVLGGGALAVLGVASLFR